MAWGNFIKVVEIHDLMEEEREKAQAAGLPSKTIVVMSQFSTEFPISGLALYDDVLVLLVCYDHVRKLRIRILTLRRKKISLLNAQSFT